MAVNLFTKTFRAQEALSSSEEVLPSFVFCEMDDGRAEAFLQDLKDKGGSELASRCSRAGNGKE